MKRFLTYIENDPIFSKTSGGFPLLVLLYLIVGGYLVTTTENEYLKIIFFSFYFISIIIFNIFFIIRFVRYRKKLM
ncbi:hypothetical protein DXB51_16160 [Bacillus cereus]|nr:hypothetical protein DXB51_16160 [Bacillus cereus]